MQVNIPTDLNEYHYRVEYYGYNLGDLVHVRKPNRLTGQWEWAVGIVTDVPRHRGNLSDRSVHVKFKDMSMVVLNDRVWPFGKKLPVYDVD